MFRTFAVLVAFGLTVGMCAEPQGVRTSSGLRPRIGIDPKADYIIPTIYDGGGYTTSFFLSNRDSKTLHLAVYFTGKDGTPLALPIQQIGSTDCVTIDLEVNQSATFQTTGESSAPLDGYAMVFNYDRPAADPAAALAEGLFSGQATFMKNQNGVYIETLVPLSSGFETASAVAFDNTTGYSTAIILVNAGPMNTSDVTFTIRDRAGNMLQRDDVMLAPGTKQCINLNAQYPNTAGQTGRVFVSSSGSYLTLIALRINATGGFTTLLPWSIDSRLMP